MDNKKNLIIIIPFVSIIIFFFSLSIFTEDMELSHEEARPLAQKPPINILDIKETTANIEKYLVDQFPQRRRFLKLYSLKDKFLKKINTRDLYISEDDWIFFESIEFDMETMKDIVGQVALSNPDKKFYYAAVPTKNLSLADKYEFVENNVSKTNLLNIEEAFGKLRLKNLEFINVYDKLSEGNLLNQEEKQFRTDFHWNALGAKDGVDMILDTMYKRRDIDSLALDSDYTVEIVDGKYLGDLNRRFSYIYGNDDKPLILTAKNSQNFSYYMSNDKGVMGKREELISPFKNKEEIYYADIYTQNLGFYRTENPQALNDKSIMVIKDSMQNPTSDIFSHTFREVKIIDPRMEQPVDFQEAIKSVDIVLIMLNQNNNSDEVREYLGE